MKRRDLSRLPLSLCESTLPFADSPTVLDWILITKLKSKDRNETHLSQVVVAVLCGLGLAPVFGSVPLGFAVYSCVSLGVWGLGLNVWVGLLPSDL